MLYLAIPAHNEVATIGVLLWRLRTVLAEFPREYEVVVYDDASTDETAEVARQYEHAMPVTVLRGERRLGYAGAVDALLRHVAGHTRYPRRDAVLLLQGDFTDPPEIVPEFARRFEGGADLVVGERQVVADAPVAVRRLFRGAHWALRPFVRVDGVRDLTASMRLVRISALRDALRDAGDASVVLGDSWTANADLLLRLAPHARRVEAVPVEPTYGVRMRETRRVALRDALAALKWAWRARGRRVAVRLEAEVADGDRRPGRTARRRDEPELSVEKLREKVREARGGRDAAEERDPRARRGRGERAERPARERTDRGERTERTERPVREDRSARSPRGERPERPEKPERAPHDRVESPESRLASLDPAAGSTARAAKPDRRERPPVDHGSVEGTTRERPAGERPARPERTPRSERGRRRDERKGVAAAGAQDDALDDPFAPRVPRPDPFAAALDRAPTDAGTRETVATSSDDGAGAVMEHAHLADRSTGVDEDAHHAAGADDAEDAIDDTGDSADGDDSIVGEARKRRRRSRRGRRRRSGERGEAGAEETTQEAESAVAGTEADADPSPPPRAIPTEGAPVARRSSTDADDVGAETDSSDSSDSDDAPDGDQPRARRRGRRGRRGGSRRSRHRREHEGPADDTTSPETHESAPPPVWEGDAPSGD